VLPAAATCGLEGKAMPTHDQIVQDERQLQAFLSTLWDLERDGIHPTSDRVARDAGIPDDNQTVTRITRTLKQRGHIAGGVAMGGGVGRPTTTDPGRRAVADAVRPPTQPSNTVSGFNFAGGTPTVNLAQGSPGASFSTKVQPYESRQVDDWLRLVGTVPVEDLARTQDNIEDIHRYLIEIHGWLTSRDKDRGRLRDLLGHFLNVVKDPMAVAASASGVISTAVQIHQALGH
jgi:hypothetical protein